MIGRIYKITSINTDKIYIGSTTKKLTERLRKHEIDYKIFKNGKYHYVKSFDILEKKDYKIQLLEKIEYETKTELFKREGYYILKYRDICVNKCIPGRTDKQYRTDNADKLREASKQYRIDNTDKIKQYYKDNVEKINEVNRQYYKDNVEKIKDRHRQYYKDNVEKIREKQNEILECVCGKTYTRSNKTQHERTKKHIAFNKQ